MERDLVCERQRVLLLLTADNYSHSTDPYSAAYSCHSANLEHVGIYDYKRNVSSAVCVRLVRDVK